MNRAGQGNPGPLAFGGTEDGTDRGTQDSAESAARVPDTKSSRGARVRALAFTPAARHLALFVVYLVAGIAVTWPRVNFLWQARLPRTRDASGYVWDLWWVAHQVAHLGNPWFTSHMAAPFGIPLGFDTTMPLAGLIMTPVTLAFGPSASFSLLTIVAPGLACYLMYRAARLWLAAPGAIAAGALFGLSSMLAWQDWYHLNIALGTLFFPAVLEAAVRLRRTPSAGHGVILGVLLGACVLVNQESAVLALVLAAVLLVPWLAAGLARARQAPAENTTRTGRWRRLVPAALAAVAALVVASPQLIAMAQQAFSGGATAPAHLLAHTGSSYGVGLAYLFAPSQRVGSFGLSALAAATASSAGSTGEGMPMFGVVLSVLALGGLAVSWRRRGAWLLAVLWLGCAWLALGPTLWVGGTQYVPAASVWNGERVSLLMPYTWVMRIPLLADLREADRFALLGLVGAALLAGTAVDWLCRHVRPTIAVAGVLAVVTVLAAAEAGWTAAGPREEMPTTLAALDKPIAADHSQSVVVDVPFGLRGGIPLYGGLFTPQALVLATADGHPRAISYTSWVPQATISKIRGQLFYRLLVGTSNYNPANPVLHATPAQLAAARQNLRHLDIGWVILWTKNPVAARYLSDTGFRFDYSADGASVYRPVS
jgi:hypothetical protein